MSPATLIPVALLPKLRTLRNLPQSGALIEEGLRARIRLAIFALMGAIVWVLLLYATWWFVTQCLSIEVFGVAVARKLLAFVLAMFLAVLILSNLNAAFSTFFLADDLQLLFALPVTHESLFVARFLESLFHSSWAVVVFGIPVLLGFGIAFHASWHYYAASVVLIPPYLAISGCLAVAVSLVLVNLFPARRLRELMVIVGLASVAFLLVVVRWMRPERFLNPEGMNNLASLIQEFNTPDAAWMPSSWVLHTLYPLLTGGSVPWVEPLLLATTAAAAYSTINWMGRRLYFSGFSRAQEGKGMAPKPRLLVNWIARILALPYRRTTRAILMKDVKLFLRDTAQWTQLLLLLALIVIYVANAQHFRFLGRSGILSEQGLYVLNTGLISFMTASVAVRFVYPAVSLEGKAMWILMQSPIPPMRLLLSKCAVAFMPLWLMTMIIVAVSTWILESPPKLTLYAYAHLTLVCVSITGMGVGMGAIFPNFQAEHPAKIPSGHGGVMYMIASTSFIGVLTFFTAIPIFLWTRARYAPEIALPVIALSLVVTLIIVVLGTAVPLILGARSLQRGEWH